MLHGIYMVAERCKRQFLLCKPTVGRSMRLSERWWVSGSHDELVIESREMTNPEPAPMCLACKLLLLIGLGLAVETRVHFKESSGWIFACPRVPT